MSNRVLMTTAVAALALALAGCGGSGGDGGVVTSSAAAPSQTSVNPGDMTDQQAPPDRLVVDVTIKGGQVTPTNETLQAKVKNPIVIKVDSDVADELHVHSTPDHTFKIEPKGNQYFQFTVDVPGQVAVELHELNKTIATIQVQQ